MLLDSSALYALGAADDDRHDDAVECANSLDPFIRRVTTQAILAETYVLLRYRFGKRAFHWLDWIEEARKSNFLRILYTDARDGSTAETLLRKFADQKLSYVDALTLAVAPRYNVGAIFGFGRHLTLTGIPLLPGRSGGR